MHTQQRFAAECLAVADSLRHVRGQVRFLIDANDPRTSNYPDAWVILANAADVATSLETLAQRIATVEV